MRGLEHARQLNRPESHQDLPCAYKQAYNLRNSANFFEKRDSQAAETSPTEIEGWNPGPMNCAEEACLQLLESWLTERWGGER
jgi:hypothetical protein